MTACARKQRFLLVAGTLIKHIFFFTCVFLFFFFNCESFDFLFAERFDLTF